MAAAAWILAILTFLTAAPGSAQSTEMFRGGPAHTGVYAGPGPATGPRVTWQRHVDGTVRSSPAVTDQSVYVGTSAGMLLRLDRGTGAVAWRYDAGSALPSSPAVAGGRVVIAARDGSVHAVDARTGEGVWATAPAGERPLPWGREGWDYWVSSPTVAGDRVLVGLPDGRLVALELRSGEVVWSVDLGARTRSSPAVVDGTVFIGDDAGVVHALGLADGRTLWTHRTEGAGMSSAEYGWDRVSLQASPAVADGVVYIGSRDGGIYALDAATGRRLWYADHGAPWVVASVAVHGDRLWAGSSDGQFVAALDTETGREVWRTDAGARVFASPALAGMDDSNPSGTPPSGGTLYVADHDGRVRALDPATGAIRWRYDLGRGVMIQSSPVPYGDRLYFGADDGSITALEPAPAPPRMAVFWDSALAGRAFRARNGRMLRDYLADHGYTVLDVGALGPWLRARIDDGAPSVVVFALDVLPGPTDVAASGTSAASSGALDRLVAYLQAGGKAVWTGFPPGALVRDSAGQPAGIDYGITEREFGVDASRSAQGQYGAAPTATGEAWGLRSVHLSELAAARGPGITVLAVDERGSPAAVVRSLGGPKGTGLVLLWGTGADWDRLEEIRSVAEYGVLRAP